MCCHSGASQTDSPKKKLRNETRYQSGATVESHANVYFVKNESCFAPNYRKTNAKYLANYQPKWALSGLTRIQLIYWQKSTEYLLYLYVHWVDQFSIY
jgi:hypothetical protein